MAELDDVIYIPDAQIVKNAAVYGLGNSIRRAKFPMSVDANAPTKELTDGISRLATSGPGEGHDQWLTGVVVQFDLTFSVKAWTEAERYHFFDFVSSQSTIHRITKFNLDNAYMEYVDPRMIEVMKELVDGYNGAIEAQRKFDLLADTDGPDRPADPARMLLLQEWRVELADFARRKYLQILYSNPCGFRLTAGMTTNYRQLKTIYRQRKDHRLPEWQEFCHWIETLPHSELITGVTQ